MWAWLVTFGALVTKDCAMESHDPPVDFLFLANNSSNCPISSGSSTTGTSLHTNDLNNIYILLLTGHLTYWHYSHNTYCYLYGWYILYALHTV